MTTFDALYKSVVHDALHVSVPAFLPELILCGTVVLMLALRLSNLTARIPSFYIALAGAAIALFVALGAGRLDFVSDPQQGPTELFTGLLIFDPLTVFFRAVLLTFAVLFILLTRLTKIPDRADEPDFYTLLLGATLGMCLMSSANHLLMVFIGVEMASVPSYVMAGMMRHRKSSEAALKYAVFGAGTAGIMLYGISLLSGVLGTAHIPTIAQRLGALLVSTGANAWDGYRTVLILAGLMIAVGLAFKLSAVPFHFWCPDVFEGASAEVDAFLSVASKAAALGLLIRVAVGVSYVPTPHEASPPIALYSVADSEVSKTKANTPSRETSNNAVDPSRALAEVVSPAKAAQPATIAPKPPSDIPLPIRTERDPMADEKEVTTAQEVLSAKQLATAEDRAATNVASLALAPVRAYVAGLIALLAAITCTFGNLAAYGQTNIKRLLAYSTIGHAGYMMMPVAAAIALLDAKSGGNIAAARDAITSVGFYVVVYVFMNLGAFAAVAFLRNAIHSEEIADYAGLIKRCPGTVVCLGLLLFSLIGLPPLAGFAGKFQAFAALASAGLWSLFVVAGFNTVVSLFYYLRVVKTMVLEPEPEHRRPVQLPVLGVWYLSLITLPVVILGIWWDPLYRSVSQAVGKLFL